MNLATQFSMKVQILPSRCRSDSIAPRPATGPQRLEAGLNGVPGHTGTSCDPVCPQCHRHACESFAGTGRVCTQCGYCERPLSR